MGVIGSIRSYFTVFRWLLAVVLKIGRKYVLGAFVMDLVAMGALAVVYGGVRSALSRFSPGTEEIEIAGWTFSLYEALGIAAGAVLLTMLLNSAARLASRSLALKTIPIAEREIAVRIYRKLSEIHLAGENGESPDAQRMITHFSRSVGLGARLVVMIISGTMMTLFFALGAMWFSPVTVAVFAVMGTICGYFLVRNNKKVTELSRRLPRVTRRGRKEVGKILQRERKRGEVGESLDDIAGIYENGSCRESSECYGERLFRIYLSNFITTAGGAFAVGVTILFPLLFKGKEGGGMFVDIAMIIVGIALLRQAFGTAGSVATFVTRLNLRYRDLVDCRRFLDQGILPDMEVIDDSEEEEG